MLFANANVLPWTRHGALGANIAKLLKPLGKD
jgi:hypothetical protein